MFQVACKTNSRKVAQSLLTTFALVSMVTSCGAEMIQTESENTPSTTNTTPVPPQNQTPGNTPAGNGACDTTQAGHTCIPITTGGASDANGGINGGARVNHITCGSNIRPLAGQMKDLFDDDPNSDFYFQDPLSNNDAVIFCEMPEGMPSFKSIKLFAPRERDCELQSASLYIATSDDAGPMVEESWGFWWIQDDEWTELGTIRDQGQEITIPTKDGGEHKIPFAAYTSTAAIPAKKFGLRFNVDSCNNFFYDEHLISEITVEP